MRLIRLFRPTLLGLSIAGLLAACNSDTIVSPGPGGSTVNPSEGPSGNFTGRYAFNAQEFSALEAYSAELGFEITDTNGARFIADALNRVVDNDLPELEILEVSRLTVSNQFFIEQNGLEPLFDSGFKLRTRNCKGGGTSSIEVFDAPLNFRPDPDDATQTRFEACSDPINATSSQLSEGDQVTFIKKYDGLFGAAERTDAEANFSDLFSLKRTLFNEDESIGGVEDTGRVDLSVKRVGETSTYYFTTENLRERFLDPEGELLAEFGEVAQREIKLTNQDKLLRFQALRFVPNQTSDVLSSKYSSEEGRSVSATTPVKVGNYEVAGDPYHPNNSSPITPPPPRVGLVEGGMAAIGKNGKIELVFDQEPVEGFTNIVRVIKTIGTTVTHDCKVPYFSVYRTNATENPRLSFAAEGKCLVDGQPFPPPVEPPPPPPEQSCFVRDLVNTLEDNDPTPLVSTLGVVLDPVTDGLCLLVGSVPLPIPTP